MRRFATTAAAIVTAVSLAGTSAFAAVTTNPAFPSLVGNGSSFQGNFQASCSGKFTGSTVAGFSSKGKVTYTASSSGTGMTALGSGTADFAGTDAPDIITSAYAPADGGARAVVPITAAPIAFIYNVNDSAGNLIRNIKLTSGIISDIYLGNITKWNDAAIQVANGATYSTRYKKYTGGLSTRLPNIDIKVAARTDGSGTTANVVLYLAANTSGKGWNASGSKNMTGGGSGTSYANTESLASGIQKKANSAALIEYVAQTDGTIAYADAPDVPTSIGKALLKNVAGAYVGPTSSAAAKLLTATSVITAVSSNGYLSPAESASLFSTNVTGAYQLTVVTYIMGSKKMSTNNKAVRAYANFILTSCQGSAGYTRLPASLVTVAKEKAALIGSVS